MATIWLSEYADVPQTVNGVVQVPVEPAVAIQTITTSGTSAQSSAFNARTRYVVAYGDVLHHGKVGSNPTATTSDKPLAAGVNWDFAVKPGKGWLFAAITG